MEMVKMTNEAIEEILEEKFQDGRYTVIGKNEAGVFAKTDNPYQKNEDGSQATFFYSYKELED